MRFFLFFKKQKYRYKCIVKVCVRIFEHVSGEVQKRNPRRVGASWVNNIKNTNGFAVILKAT